MRPVRHSLIKGRRKEAPNPYAEASGCSTQARSVKAQIYVAGKSAAADAGRTASAPALPERTGVEAEKARLVPHFAQVSEASEAPINKMGENLANADVADAAYPCFSDFVQVETPQRMEVKVKTAQITVDACIEVTKHQFGKYIRVFRELWGDKKALDLICSEADDYWPKRMKPLTSDATSGPSLKNTKFELVIDALNSDARFKQVTNSRLVGYDRTKLKLTVGDKTATVSSSGNDNAGNRVQNIVYTPSGVIIDATPRVLGGGGISLDVDAQISSFKANTNGLIGSPTLILRQLTTTVGLRDGDVMLLGGLTESQSTESTSGLHFLPASWSAKSGSNAQTDLVLVVSAKILAN